MSSSKSTLDRKFDKTHHKKRLLLAGEFVNQDKGEDTDEWAKRMISSVVPVQFDLTAPCRTRTQHLEMEIKADLLILLGSVLFLLQPIYFSIIL
jgi:hypothetical protein